MFAIIVTGTKNFTSFHIVDLQLNKYLLLAIQTIYLTWHKQASVLKLG